MRIPVNLLSEPFRRDRPMLVASTACAVILAGLLAPWLAPANPASIDLLHRLQGYPAMNTVPI